MAHTDESAPTRVASRDGTGIAYWTSGHGPPLLLVHGSIADHTRWRPLLPYLEPHVTVHAMDRRGRGGSGDGPDYGVTREFEDVAAVVDSVGEDAGSAVDVYGHSFGGLCAFGGAALTPNIRKLVLYEGWPVPNPAVLAMPPGLEKRLDALLAEGNREAVVETFLREFVRMPDEELHALRAQPSWQARIASAHTINREARGIQESPFDHEQAAKLAMPILLFIGEDSPDAMKAGYETVVATLPNGRIALLEGQQHAADVMAPELIADHIMAFLRHES